MTVETGESVWRIPADGRIRLEEWHKLIDKKSDVTGSMFIRDYGDDGLLIVFLHSENDDAATLLKLRISRNIRDRMRT